jgi:hypothetical protein
LELELDEVPVDVIPFELKPNEKWTRSVEKTSLAGGVLQGTVTQLAVSDSAEPTSSINGLPTDDRAWAIIPPRQVQNVLIVSPGNLFLRKVFEANPLVNIQVTNELPTEWPADTIVVLHRLVPEKLPAAKILVIDPETNSDAWTLGEAIENPIITEQDQDSPLMTHIRLDNVLLPEARRIEFADSAKSLVATVNGETVYALLNRPAGACLVLSVNLERSDLAFRTAFPIMITNALSWFAGQPGELQPSLAGGQLATLNQGPTELSIRQQELRLMSPAGTESPLVSQQVGPLNQVGIWNVVAAKTSTGDSDNENDIENEPVQRFAVNLASEQESELRPEPALLDSAGEEMLLGSVWFSRPVWFYLIVAATLFCALEWFLYHRRLIS